MPRTVFVPPTCQFIYLSIRMLSLFVHFSNQRCSFHRSLSRRWKTEKQRIIWRWGIGRRWMANNEIINDWMHRWWWWRRCGWYENWYLLILMKNFHTKWTCESQSRRREMTKSVHFVIKAHWHILRIHRGQYRCRWATMCVHIDGWASSDESRLPKWWLIV